MKFRDPITGLLCDVNTNDQLGLFNTLLITKYCNLDPILRQLLQAIKKWAKSFSYNNPSDPRTPSSFTSYSLTLMTIGFLQVSFLNCLLVIDLWTLSSFPQMKGSLPALQANLLPLPLDDRVELDETFWIRSKNGDRLRCDYRFDHAEDWKPSFQYSNVQEALLDWFKWAVTYLIW